MITAAKLIILFHSTIILPQILIKKSKKNPLWLFAIAQFITHTVFDVVVDDEVECFFRKAIMFRKDFVNFGLFCPLLSLHVFIIIFTFVC